MIKKSLALMSGLALMLCTALVIAQAAQKQEAVPAEGPPAKVQRAVFAVENLTCGACLNKINAALGPVEGFSGMGANLFRKMVAVDFIAPLAPEKIGTVITELGYPATLDSVESLTEKETFAYMRSQRRGGGYGGGGCCGGSPTAAVSAESQCPGTGAGCSLPQGTAATDSAKDI